MKPKTPIDFQKIIRDLLESGMTQQQIAKSCGTGQSHVSCLARGDRQEPRHSLGERLRALHAERCRSARRKVTS